MVNGSKIRIEFRNSSPAPNARGQFVTEDPAVIAAMEKSASFGTTYKCIHSETFGDPDPAPRSKAAPKTPTPPADDEGAGSGADDTDGGNDAGGNEDANTGGGSDVTAVPGITTIQGARDYLVANCGATASKLPNGPAVKKFAAENKINFVDLA
jgi:hypothetical protein